MTVQPVGQTNIVPGSNVSFSVTATGTAPLSYQWQKGDMNLTDGGSITGATTATLTITGVMESDEGGYRCVVTNIAGMETSNTAMLTVGESKNEDYHTYNVITVRFRENIPQHKAKQHHVHVHRSTSHVRTL